MLLSVLPVRTILLARLALAMACCTLLIGCASRLAPPEKAEGRFAAPAVSIIDIAGEHVIVAKTPVSGWGVLLERTVEVHHGHELFVTLREPHSQFIVNKEPQEQHVGTALPSSRHIAVYARTAPHDGAPGGPYQLAAEAGPAAQK